MVTQVADIIIYSLEDFYSQKLSQKLSLPVNVKLKIDQILEMYDCFKEHIPTNSPGGFVSNYGHKQDYYRQSNKPRCNNNNLVYAASPNILGKLKTTVGDDNERELISNLNKMTFANYDVLIKKIVRKLDESTLQNIIRKIIVKCVNEPTYISLYVKALDKIICSYGHEAKTVVQNVITEFRQSMFSSFDEITNHVKNSTDVSYDTFCLQQKLKMNVVGVNKLVLESIRKNVYTLMTVDEVCKHLLDILLVYKSNHQVAEVIAQMLFDFFTVEKNKNLIKELERLLHDELTDISARAKFKILDILDIYKF
jgi:hypothetical protein